MYFDNKPCTVCGADIELRAHDASEVRSEKNPDGTVDLTSATTRPSSAPASSWRKWPAPAIMTCARPRAPGTRSWKTASQPRVAGSPSE